METKTKNQAPDYSKLTGREQDVLKFMYKQLHEKGYPPSVREICKAVGFKSTSTAHHYLEKLMKLGFIHKDPSKPRALKILDIKNMASEMELEKNDLYTVKADNNVCGYEISNVPIIGKVTAGKPILAVENIDNYFPVPKDFIHDSTAFMLKVQGESMIEAGILDGDLVLVRQQSSANNGEIVVALIEDEATIKTFYKEKDHFRLQPQNSYMDPIIVKDNLSILGKVIGVYRKI